MNDQAKQLLLAHIQELSDLYYQNRAGEGSEKLKELIRELTTFAPTLSQDRQQEYMMALKSVMEAMELQDYVLLADVLSFDIADAFLAEE